MYSRYEILLDLVETLAEMTRREREAALARAAARALGGAWWWQPVEDHAVLEDRIARRSTERARRARMRRDLELLARQRGRGGLSALEAAVAIMWSRGTALRDCAAALAISIGTVRSVRGRLRTKLVRAAAA